MKILIINPNSDTAMTASILEAGAATKAQRRKGGNICEKELEKKLKR